MRHVLIIDDESGIRVALRRFFERQEWSVSEAIDGPSALASLLSGNQTTPPDVVICDVNLPGVTGEQIVERLAAEQPELVSRVILTTGEDIESAPAGSVLATHPHLLQKPFDLAVLNRFVDEICRAA